MNHIEIVSASISGLLYKDKKSISQVEGVFIEVLKHVLRIIKASNKCFLTTYIPHFRKQNGSIKRINRWRTKDKEFGASVCRTPGYELVHSTVWRHISNQSS